LSRKRLNTVNAFRSIITDTASTYSAKVLTPANKMLTDCQQTGSRFDQKMSAD